MYDLWSQIAVITRWTLPEESSRPIIKRALEGGINFFDTANSYSDGSSEEIVGRARDFARREDVVVAPKVFHRVGDLPEGLSCAQILRSIDDSLRRSAWIMSISRNSSLGLQHADRRDAGSPERRGKSRESALYRRVIYARFCSLLKHWNYKNSTAGRSLSVCRITTI